MFTDIPRPHLVHGEEQGVAPGIVCECIQYGGVFHPIAP